MLLGGPVVEVTRCCRNCCEQAEALGAWRYALTVCVERWRAAQWIETFLVRSSGIVVAKALALALIGWTFDFIHNFSLILFRFVFAWFFVVMAPPSFSLSTIFWLS